MFTGIVEHVGRVVRVERQPDLLRLQIDLGPIAEGVKLGDSIAVLGVCLTVTRIEGSLHTFEVIPETLARTRMARLEPGDLVNLERAMAASARFDGHLVQGHIDGLGRVESLERAGNEVRLHVRAGHPAPAGGGIVAGPVGRLADSRGDSPARSLTDLTDSRADSLMDFLVDKGSIAIDGVSLTIVRVENERFHVALIPHTLEHTTLSRLHPGDAVHLEVDVFAKLMKRQLDRVLPGLVEAELARRARAEET